MAGRKRANGEGTVYQRADGRWEGADYVLAVDGSSKRVRVYGATRREASDKLAAKLADSRHGRPVASDATMTLGDYLHSWLTTVAVGRVRPTTYTNYETYVRAFLIPGLGHTRLGTLSVTDVRLFLDAIQTVCQCCTRGWDARRNPDHPRKQRRPRCCAIGACCQRRVKPATVRYIRAVLSAALAHAVREELLHRNVASLVRLPAPRRSGFQPFTAGEARKYLFAAAFHRHGQLFELALRTGIRQGELLGLRWSDIDLATGYLSVRRTLARTKGGVTFQPPKTPASQRRIMLPRECVTSLRRYRRRQELDRREAGDRWQDLDLVFASPTGKPLDPAGVHRQHETICYLAEVRYIRFHDLRHTCATLLLEQGVELVTIKELLGHAQLHVRPSRRRSPDRGWVWLMKMVAPRGALSEICPSGPWSGAGPAPLGGLIRSLPGPLQRIVAHHSPASRAHISRADAVTTSPQEGSTPQWPSSQTSTTSSSAWTPTPPPTRSP